MANDADVPNSAAAHDCCAPKSAEPLPTVEPPPNVKAVEVSYADGTATVVSEGDAVDDEAVIQAVESAGYTAHAPAAGGS